MRGFPIHPHFRWHHRTTPLLAWVFLTSRSLHGIAFLVLNAVMHAMLYTFLSGVIGQPPWLKAAIRRWQYVQLLGGALLAASACAQRVGGLCPNGSITDDCVPLGLYLLYLFLWRMELRDEQLAKERSTGDKKE